MRRMIEKILNYYGRDLVICRAGVEVPVRGFLQTATGTASQYAKIEVCPLGTVDQGRYVYIGPVVPELEVSDQVRMGEDIYVVRQTETVDGAYTWAMCVEKGREDAWGVSG